MSVMDKFLKAIQLISKASESNPGKVTRCTYVEGGQCSFEQLDFPFCLTFMLPIMLKVLL